MATFSLTSAEYTGWLRPGSIMVKLMIKAKNKDIFKFLFCIVRLPPLSFRLKFVDFFPRLLELFTPFLRLMNWLSKTEVHLIPLRSSYLLDAIFYFVKHNQLNT